MLSVLSVVELGFDDGLDCDWSLFRFAPSKWDLSKATFSQNLFGGVGAVEVFGLSYATHLIGPGGSRWLLVKVNLTVQGGGQLNFDWVELNVFQLQLHRGLFWDFEIFEVVNELKIVVKSFFSASEFRTICLAPVLYKFFVLRLNETLTFFETQVSLALNQSKIRVKSWKVSLSLSLITVRSTRRRDVPILDCLGLAEISNLDVFLIDCEFSTDCLNLFNLVA